MRVKSNSLLAVLVGLTLNIGFSGSAQAALQGRDLDGNLTTAEAYYDTVLDITWLADANYAQTSGYDVDVDGRMTWADANTWAANLSLTNGVQVFDNWRLPTLTPINGIGFQYKGSFNGSTDEGYNISAPGSVYAGSKASEMAHLFYNTLGNPSYQKLTGGNNSGACPAPAYCVQNVGPFSNLKSSIYWTGLEYGKDSSKAWEFLPLDGSQDRDPKGGINYAWAVSSGDVAAVPEAETYAMMLAGLGLVGFMARRRKQIAA